MQLAEWTRVKDVHSALAGQYSVYNMNQDLKKEQSKKIVRQNIARERGVYMFDPEEYKRNDPSLRIELQRLSEEQLRVYAMMASDIRKEISEKVAQLGYSKKEQQSNEMTHLEKQFHMSAVQSKQLSQEDYQEASNKRSPRMKKLTMRDLDSAARLRIVTIAASNNFTQQEIADKFNIKLWVVRDLTRALKQKNNSILKKRVAELEKARKQAILVSCLSNAFKQDNRSFSARQIQ